MDREDLINRAQRVTAAWNSHDPTQIAVLFSPECTSRDSGMHGARHGREAVVARARLYLGAFADLDFRLSAVNVDGSIVFSRWLAVGTHTGPLNRIPATGRKMEIDGCTVHEFDPHGYIHAETIYWDQAQLLRDLGVLGAPEE